MSNLRNFVAFWNDLNLARIYYSQRSHYYVQWHSHKKRKDSLETGAVLCAYVENQSILETILLYRTSKYKQTKRSTVKTDHELKFYFPMWLISGFFLSSVKIQTCLGQTLLKIIATRQRNKLALYQTQHGNRWPN